MPHEELDLFSDQRLLATLCASANDARDIVRRTTELIEQSRIMLRELDTHGPTADEPRKYEGSSSFPLRVGLVHIRRARRPLQPSPRQPPLTASDVGP